MNYEADKASEKPIARGIRAGLADTTTQADDTGATTAAETPAGLVTELQAHLTKIARLLSPEDGSLSEAGYATMAVAQLDIPEIVGKYEARDQADRARLEARVKELETTLRQSRSIWQGVHEELEAERQALTDLRAGIQELAEELDYKGNSPTESDDYHGGFKFGCVSTARRLTSLLSTSPVGGAHRGQPVGDGGDPTAEAERAGEMGS